MLNFKKFINIGMLILFSLALPATAAELLTNGDFETGDLTGWTATANGTGSCDTDWNISSVGGNAATGCQPGISGTLPGAPSDGNNAAFNSFDGDGPQQFRLTQSFVVPSNISSATLSWIETYNVDLTFGGIGSTQRTFTVELSDATDTTIYGVINTQLIGDVTGVVEIDWTAFNNDITALLNAHVGETVTLAFTNIIPENFTGPGGFGLDSVSLNVVISAASIPTLSQWALLFLIFSLIFVGLKYNNNRLIVKKKYN